ncbi:hypothetical protein ZIOFF_047142 [Zingiber officinale]|uniref:Uncharacterized protein n=1 Tax=Zingiber officinale TaxID=94328 RepID=A0A8J5FXA3_ZINOF|nr:hypothetical protein ZIOFF_047142 [Zingiber officinale]
MEFNLGQIGRSDEASAEDRDSGQAAPHAGEQRGTRRRDTGVFAYSLLAQPHELGIRQRRGKEEASTYPYDWARSVRYWLYAMAKLRLLRGFEITDRTCFGAISCGFWEIKWGTCNEVAILNCRWICVADWGIVVDAFGLVVNSEFGNGGRFPVDCLASLIGFWIPRNESGYWRMELLFSHVAIWNELFPSSGRDICRNIEAKLRLLRGFEITDRTCFGAISCGFWEINWGTCNGDNCKIWKERVLLHLGWLDIDYAIRKDEPLAINDFSIPD